jgi:ubiquinone/menaquinone biosynthesis C-methylase UbiE
MSGEPLREQESTYFVQDHANLQEMKRLEIQDKMANIGMGGVLPELTDHSRLQRVLDVGCGTGCWLMETAMTYPTIEKLVGIDISDKMIAYARAQAQVQQLDERVQFQTMNALNTLEFSDASFDLVNQRAGFSWLRTWNWKKILMEYQRVTRPGGIIRITEPDVWSGGNSPALTKLCDIVIETMYRSEQLFNASRNGVTGELARLMTESGIQGVQTRVYPMVCRAGTEIGQYFYEDMLYFFRVGLPFFKKWTNVPENYEEIYQQALKEMQQPDFVATQSVLTAWGTTSIG